MFLNFEGKSFMDEIEFVVDWIT